MGSPLDVARGLSSAISARADETEGARCVPADLIAQFADAGFLRMYVPTSLNGPQFDPATACQVVETLSAADGSTGWTAFILNTSFFPVYLEPGVAKAILDDVPASGMAGLFGPLGKGIPNGDGTLSVDGRWPFNSGSPHASWFSQGIVVSGGENPFDWRFAFLPKADVEILDTWRVAGLRGTASHDVTATGAIVPEERTVNPIFTEAPQDAPHFRWPFFSLLATLMGGFPLGVARRALDEFENLAITKARGGSTALADTESVAVGVMRAEGAVRAARAYLLDAIGSAWDSALAGNSLTTDQRVDLRGAAINAMRAGIDAVDTVFALAGGGALYDGSPLQRCWRDIHAGSHHIFFSADHMQKVGRVILGRPVDSSVI
jgi:alkylation response protein AidB-like acyl-CoA dehydrogenase